MSFRHDPGDCLDDIIENGTAVTGYIVGMSNATFLADRRTVDAVERCVERLCEAAHRLEERAAELMPAQPWGKIRGMGNQLHHGYDRIDPDTFWNTITRDVPALVADARVTLERLDAAQGRSPMP